MTHVTTRSGWAASVLLLLALLASSCAGSSEPDAAAVTNDAPSEQATAAPAEDFESDSDAGGDNAGPDASDNAASEPAKLEPGSVAFRTANLLDEPVDVYVRSTGLVQANFVTTLEAGAVSDFAAPPEGGVFVVTTAGAGDPTCVTGCDHFITELSGFPEEGLYRTVVLYEDEFSGPTALELWEQPTADRTGTTNAIAPAQSGKKLATVTAVSVTDNDWGLRIATNLSAGCLEPINVEGILIGGNQTPTFAFNEATTFSLHDSDDRECAEPLDGPFPFTAEADSRTHVFLRGAPGSLEALTLAMTVGEIVAPPAGAADRDTVVELLAVDAAATFGLTVEEGACLSGLIVDNVGADVLYVDGALVELDVLSAAASDLVGAAIVDSVPTCGIDSAVFSG